VETATHTIFLGEVQSARAGVGNPLAYFHGTFGRFAKALDDTVHQELRERVLSRTVALGESITVDRMAVELGVGRVPVFHALQQLRSDGLVSPHPEQGYLVTPLTIDIAWQAYDARAAIECGVIDQTAGQLTPVQLARLRADAEATLPWIRDDHFVDFEAYLATNTTFHQTLVALAGNATLMRGYRQLAMAAVMSRALRGVQETRDRFTHDHVIIAERLEAEDLKGARDMVLDHAAAGKERIRIAIEAAGGQY